MTAEDEPDDDGQKADLLLESAQPLAHAIQAETRGVAIRLAAETTRTEHLRGSPRCSKQLPGQCPVSLVIELADGAEAVSRSARAPRRADRRDAWPSSSGSSARTWPSSDRLRASAECLTKLATLALDLSSLSSSCLSNRPSVSGHQLRIERRAPSIMSARAQSIVSEMEGALRESSRANFLHERDQLLRELRVDVRDAQLDDGDLARR